MGSGKKINFEDYYSEIYGGRWQNLKPALLLEPEGYCVSEGLLKAYYLDRASAAAARALDVKPGDHVLDMCAAPGGKTLLLALSLAGKGSLISNDRSSDRRRRLKDVVETHLPVAFRDIVNVTGHDASRWGLHEQDTYDRILLDAPLLFRGACA